MMKWSKKWEVVSKCETLEINEKSEKITVTASYHVEGLNGIELIKQSLPLKNDIFPPVLVQPTQPCATLCGPVGGSTPGFPVLHYLPRFAQTHVHWVDDAIQQFHLLSSPSFLDLNLSQHQGLFQWVSSSNQVVKVLELQLQHQSFQ